MKLNPMSCGAEDVTDLVVLSDPSLRLMDRVRLLLDSLLPDMVSIQVFEGGWRRLIGALSIEAMLVADLPRNAAGSGNTLSLVIKFVLEERTLGNADSQDIVVCPWVYDTN